MSRDTTDDEADLRAGIEARVRAVRAKAVEGLLRAQASVVATFGRVTRQHSSVPSDMADVKAILRLEP